ncbi:hypothetical protein Plhal304r1_c013g0049541 [Plasmopara halstedii]
MLECAGLAKSISEAEATSLSSCNSFLEKSLPDIDFEESWLSDLKSLYLLPRCCVQLLERDRYRSH